MHNKYNVLESSPDHPLCPVLWRNCLSRNWSRVPERLGTTAWGPVESEEALLYGGHAAPSNNRTFSIGSSRAHQSRERGFRVRGQAPSTPDGEGRGPSPLHVTGAAHMASLAAEAVGNVIFCVQKAEEIWEHWWALLKATHVLSHLPSIFPNIIKQAFYSQQYWLHMLYFPGDNDYFMSLFQTFYFVLEYSWTVVLGETLESPLDCKEIQPVHPKADQSWVFIGRTDAEAETPILWPPHVKSWLIGKYSDAGKDWGQEKGTTEDEMVRWHHRREGHEFEKALGVGNDGQGGLACCILWGRKELDITEWLEWTEMNWTEWLISNVVILVGSSGQQRVSARRIPVSILPQTPLPARVSH